MSFNATFPARHAQTSNSHRRCVTRDILTKLSSVKVERVPGFSNLRCAYRPSYLRLTHGRPSVRMTNRRFVERLFSAMSMCPMRLTVSKHPSSRSRTRLPRRALPSPHRPLVNLKCRIRFNPRFQAVVNRVSISPPPVNLCRTLRSTLAAHRVRGNARRPCSQPSRALRALQQAILSLRLQLHRRIHLLP